MKSTIALLAAACVGLGTLTGCTTSTVQGSALRDPRINKDEVIPGLLNPGNYPTKPRPDLGKAGDAFKGGLVESRRMADFVVLPFEVDPDLVSVGGLQTGVIKDYPSISRGLPKSLFDGTDPKTHNVIAGFTALADNVQRDQQKSLQNTVVRFATPSDAAAAVADIMGRSGTIQGSWDNKPSTTQPISIPGHADTKAVTYSPFGSPYVMALTAHGPYLLAQFTIAKVGVQTAVDLAAKAIDKQIELIDRFTPTPIEGLADLPVDPDGLLARTLPSPEDSVTLGVYGPHGILAFSSDPMGDQKVQNDAGVDQIARSETTVSRARDAGASQQVVQAFSDQSVKSGYKPSAGVPGLPSARCFTKDQGASMPAAFYCVGSVDRYVVQSSAVKQAIVHQTMAAQYLMLTAQ